MNKNFYIIATVIGVAVVVGLSFWMMQPNVSAPVENTPVVNTEPQALTEDTTTSINQSIDGIGLDELDGEFQQVDSDINSL